MYKGFFQSKSGNYWITSPLFLAVVFTAVFVLFYPEFFNKYKISYRLSAGEDQTVTKYVDIDRNGVDDILKIQRKDYRNKYEISCLERSATLNKLPLLSEKISIYDTDANSSSELYFLSKAQDSVFLTVADYATGDIENVYINDFKTSFTYNPLGFADADKDGCKEFYFWICSKREEKKRYICRYNFRKKELLKTENIDARLFSGYLHEKDGEPVIVATTVSYVTKTQQELNYPETTLWLIVLDKNLNLKFEPLKYEKVNYYVCCMNVKSEGEDYICIIGDGVIRSNEERDISYMALYDYEGNFIRKKYLDKDLYLNKKTYYTIDRGGNSKIFLTSKGVGLLELDHELNIKKVHSLGGIKTPIPCMMDDIDNDGLKELVFYGNKMDKIVFVKEDMSELVTFKRNEPYTLILDCSRAQNIGENIYDASVFKSFGKSRVIKENVIIRSQGWTYFINYYKDSRYWLNYLYALTFFGAVYLFIWLLRYYITKGVENRYVAEKTIANLRYQNVTSQMSPHFTLNTMNSIASLIYKEDRETAYDYLCKLAKLVRSSLVDSGKEERTIKEELDFVRSYLDIQKFRFKERLDYEINISDNSILSIKIMPFLVQTFVENAMKHGLRNKEVGGKITVNVTEEPGGTMITVEDNGEGRGKAAAENIKSTGKGIKLVKDYMVIINKREKRNMSLEIIDIEENGQPLGTRVEIFIDTEK